MVELAAGESLELAAGSGAGAARRHGDGERLSCGRDERLETAAGAALEQNHLYAASATCRLFYAEGSVTLLLRGSFTRA